MRAKIFTALLFVAGLVLLTGVTQAQNIITTAPVVTACPGNPVSVPVVVTDFANVASISLALEFDLSVLNYTSYTNNPGLSGGFLLVNPSANQIKAAYFGLAPLNLASGSTLFTFNYSYLGGTSPLTWDLATSGNCSYSDLSGNLLNATWINGSVSPGGLPINISGQPSNATVANGGNTSFLVTVTNATAYKWQYSADGLNWTDVSNNATYQGATTNQLMITNATLSMNNLSYRCICSETGCNQSATSTAGILTVTSVTTNILVNAANTTGCPGSQVSVPVTITDGDNFSYFSMKLNYNPAVLTYSSFSSVNSGLSGGTLNVTSTAGQVFVEFNSIGVVNLGTGNLINLNFNYIGGNSALGWSLLPGACEFTNLVQGVLPSVFIDGGVNTNALAPVIITDPGNQTIIENTGASFSVNASNANTFQWQVSTNSGTTWSNLNNGINYNNVSTSSLSILNAPLSFSGYWYRCIAAENTCNQTVTSNYAMLSVSPGGGDIVATLGDFGACPDDVIVVPVNVTNFNDVSSFALIYSFDPAVLTFNSFQNTNTGLTSNGVFLSNSVNNQILIGWFSNAPTSLGNTTLTEVVFTYNGGSCGLDWDVLTPGSCQFSDTIGNPLPATFVDGSIGLAGSAPIVTQQPVAAATTIGASAMFMVNAENTNTFQWQESTNSGATWNNLTDNASNYTGSNTAMLSIFNTNMNFNGNLYRCVVTGGQCNVSRNSNPAMLTIAPLGTIVTNAGYVNTCPGGNVNVPITVSQFIDVASVSLKLNYDANALTYLSYQNSHPALSSGMLLVNDLVGAINLGWFSVTPATIADGSILVEYVFHYNNNYSDLTWDLTGGSGVYTNINGVGIPTLFVDGAVVSEGPLVIADPVDVTAFPGENKQFEVTAILSNSYQWEVNDGSGWVALSNNTTYNGVDTYILEISNITTGMNSYQYRCALNGICGIGYSEPATLSVIALIPVIANAAVITSCPGFIVAPVAVGDFNNIGSFTLVLNHPANLIYTGIQNVNSAITAAGTLSVTNTATEITISYTGTQILNIGAGVLLDLKFTATAGNGTLSWNNTASSFLTIGGATMLKTLNDGTVTINPLPGVPTGVTGSASICQGTATTAYTAGASTNANSYTWSIIPSTAGSVTGNTINAIVTWDPTYTGTAYLSVKGINTCGIGPQFSKVITVVAAPTVTLDPFAATCSGTGAFTLSGGSPANGTYTGTGISANQFNPATAGVGTHVITYTASVGGCTNSASQPITVNATPVVTLNLPISQICYNAQPYSLTGGAPANGTYSGTSVNSATGIFTPLFNLIGPPILITYTYTENGCESKGTGTITVQNCIGIDNIDGLNLSVNPNPSNGLFELNLNNVTEDVTVTIFNSIGQNVYVENVAAGSTTYTKSLDLSNQPKGIYYLRVSGSKSLLEEKIMIQ